MTEQLGRVHALLAAGNVPCELRRGPGGGAVLAAATPTSRQWDVLLWEADGDLWIRHQGAVRRLAVGGSDEAIANAVKLRVVQSWADQGDPDAKALLATIGDRYREPATGARATQAGFARSPAATGTTAPPMHSVTAQFSPWGFGLRITQHEPQGGPPTSWAWQFGPGTVVDYYRSVFGAWRSAVTGPTNSDKR